MSLVDDLLATPKYRYLLVRERDYQTAQDPDASPDDLREIWDRHTTRPEWLPSRSDVLLRRHPQCPEDVLDEILAADPTAASDIAANPSTPASTLISFMRHPDWTVAVNAQMNPALPREVVGMLADATGGEWPHLLSNPACPPRVLHAAAASEATEIRVLAAANMALSILDLETLLADPAPEVRRSLAWNPSLSAEHLQYLSDTTDADVHLNLLRNPSTPPLALQRSIECLIEPACLADNGAHGRTVAAHTPERTAA